MSLHNCYIVQFFRIHPQEHILSVFVGIGTSRIWDLYHNNHNMGYTILDMCYCHQLQHTHREKDLDHAILLGLLYNEDPPIHKRYIPP